MTDEVKSKSAAEAQATKDESAAETEAARVFGVVKKHLDKLISKIDQAEEVVDSLSLYVAELDRIFETAQLQGSRLHPSVSRASRTLDRRQSSAQVDEHLRQLAEAGAHSLEIKLRADGRAEVCIDGGKRFTLPPMLADVLRILAIDNGPSHDDFVGWKTLDEVAILLGKDTGRRIRKHSVTQNVYRLRKAMLAQGGANPFLIQSSRHGVRFARRRRPVTAITCDRS